VQADRPVVSESTLQGPDFAGLIPEGARGQGPVFPAIDALGARLRRI